MRLSYIYNGNSYTVRQHLCIETGPGGRLNIKMPYKDSHVKDKTVSPTVLSLTWESPYLGKTVFILEQAQILWVTGLMTSYLSCTTINYLKMLHYRSLQSLLLNICSCRDSRKFDFYSASLLDVLCDISRVMFHIQLIFSSNNLRFNLQSILFFNND